MIRKSINSNYQFYDLNSMIWVCFLLLIITIIIIIIMLEIIIIIDIKYCWKDSGNN